jgi:hypothetical protein
MVFSFSAFFHSLFQIEQLLIDNLAVAKDVSTDLNDFVAFLSLKNPLAVGFL